VNDLEFYSRYYHFDFRGVHDLQKSFSFNMIVEITGANILSLIQTFHSATVTFIQ